MGLADKQRFKVFVTEIDTCPRRQLDRRRIEKYFLANDCTISASYKTADYVLLVTCGLTDANVKHALERVEKLSDTKGELVVVGCLPAIAPVQLAQKFNGKSVLTKNLSDIDMLFPGFRVKFKEVPEEHHLAERRSVRILKSILPGSIAKAIDRGNNKLAFLRISTGCNNTCSYCGIRVATGKLISKPPQAVAAEFRNLLAEGYRNFRIQDEDAGSYGVDIGSSFEELFELLMLEERGLKTTWSIFPLHPQWFLKYEKTITELVKLDRIKQILIPAQSGSNRILDLMNRNYEINELISALNRLKSANPNLELNTHLIVGFPSETEEDFRESLALMDKVAFTQVDINFYSEHDATPSSRMKDKVPREVIAERIERITNHLKELNVQYVVNQ